MPSTLVSELRYLARSGALALGGQIIAALLAFAFSLVVGHRFRAVGTGAFFEAVALFTVASFVAALGADVGLTRMVPFLKVNGRDGDVGRLLPLAVLPSFVVACVFGAVLWLFAPAIAGVVTHVPMTGAVRNDGAQTFTSYLRILAPFLPLATLSAVLVAGARGFDAMWPAVAVQNIVVPLARLGLLLAFLAAGFGALAVGVSWGVPLVLGACGCLMAIRMLARPSKVAGGQPGTSRGRLAGEFWSYAAPRGLGAAFSFVVLWLDIVLVGALASTRQAGIYAVASRYVILATFPMVALGFAIAPQVSRLVTGGRLRETARVYQAGTAWLVSLAWPTCLVMAVFAPLFMRLFGREFVAGASSLTVLSLAMLVNTGAGSCGVVLAMAGRTVINLGIAMAAAIVDVGGNFLLIPHIGMRGAALAWAAAMILVNGLTLAVLFRRYRIHPFGQATVRTGLASLACFGLLGVLFRWGLGPTWSALALSIAIGVPAYLALVWRNRADFGLNAFRALTTPDLRGSLSACTDESEQSIVVNPGFGTGL